MTSNGKFLQTYLVYLVALLLCIVLIFPILWMFSGAFKSVEELYASSIRLIPHAPTLKNFVTAFQSWPLGRWLFNSAVIAVGMTLGELLTSIFAGYGFARFDFRGKNIFFMLVIGTMIVPFAVTMIPNYIFISSLGGRNTYWGVIVPHLAKGFGVFLMRQHMMSLPPDLFDAANIDGAGSWYRLWHIAVPLSKGPLIALTILLGLNAWNIFFWPMLVLTQPEMQTLPIGLMSFTDIEWGIKWGPLMSAASVASLPALVIYAFGQKYIMGSFVLSGLK